MATIDAIQQALKDNFVNSNKPIGRCYLTPDGTFISTFLYDDGTEEVFGMPNHSSVID